MGKDTVALFRPVHLHKMNATFIQLDKYRLLNASLTREIDLFKDRVENLTLIQYNLESQVERSFLIEGEKSQQVMLLRDQVVMKDKQIVALKKQRSLFTIGGVAIGATAMYFILLAAQ